MDNRAQFPAQGQEPVAIIGYSYRLPGVAEDKDEHVWDLFLHRRSVRVNIVDEAKRYDKGQVPWDGQPNPFKHACEWEGAFINFKEAAFDPQFFHINTNDASSMDAHHKLGLLTAAEALENAGIDFSTLCGTDTGVFAGGQVSGATSFRPTFGWDEYTATGTAQTMMANRISFFLNLTGPSVTYDTACSGLMTALHGAHASLQARECKLAILVAAAVHYGHAHNPSFAQLGVLSPDGRCHSFDDSANGYMPADGVFCYILKRLSDAERDNDKIHGVIRGVHVSSAGPGEGHVGLTSGRSLTTPTAEGQRLAIEGAYSRAGIGVDSVNYIECHATGTKVGDYMEAAALGQVFGTPSRKEPLMLSSSRSNFGHMEAASAGLSILKVLLMFQHRTYLALSDNFSTPNAIIPFEKLKLQPLSICIPFPEDKVVIGINSFGFGGANGHAIIEEYVPAQPPLYSQPPPNINQAKYHTFVISAKSSKALYAAARNLIEVIQTLQSDKRAEQEILYHLAGNLAVRRTAYDVRKYFIANSLSQLRGLLEDFTAPSTEARKELNPISENVHGVCFIFPGQGSQWEGCGVFLYQTEPVFRSVVDKIDSYFTELSGKSLKAIMLGTTEEMQHEEKSEKTIKGDQGTEEKGGEFDRCDVAQPLNFMIQVGLVELCRSVGIHPTCMVGHSAGELAAAYASGAIPLKEMVRVVYERARLQQQLSGTGRMLVIPLSPQEIQKEAAESNPRIFKGIEISCYNTPNVTVVSGPEDICEAVSTHFKMLRGITCQFIRGNIPFHSSKMEAIKEDILRSLSFLDELNSPPQIPVVSTVKAIVEGSFDKYYWWLNTRTAVKFEQAISYVFKHFRPTVFIELSPHITLRSNVRDICAHLGANPPAYVPTLIRNENDSKMWANAIGTVFEKGYNLEWRTLYPNPIHIKLPNYPFDYKMIANVMLDENCSRLHGPFGAGPLLGHAIWTHDRTYEVVVSSHHFPFLKEHVAGNVPVMPAAGFIEMVLQAFGGEPVTIKNIQFSAACPIISAPCLLQLKMSSPESTLDPIDFKVSSTTSRYDYSVPWIVHCSGVVQRIPENAQKEEVLASLPDTLTKVHDQKQFYQRIPEEVISYGPNFQVVQEFSQDKTNPRHFWSKIKLDETHFKATQKAGWFLHPYMLDGVFQSFLGLSSMRAGLPFSVEEFQYLCPPQSSCVRAEIIYPEKWDDKSRLISGGDARLYNEDGSLICSLRNNTGIIPPTAEGGNFIQGWQTKAINVPEEPLVAIEISENPKDMDCGELTEELLGQLRRAVLSFLGFEEIPENDTVCKKINVQPSPAKEYIQFLWDTSQSSRKTNKNSAPLLLEFAQSLATALPKYAASTPITPQWVFTPFINPLKQIISTVLSDVHRVVRILEVSNFSNFSVLAHLQNITTNSLEYFFGSSSSEILASITDQAQLDFPVRSLQADFEQNIPSEAVPCDGFFDLIIVNMPTWLDSAEKCASFLANYKRKVTSGGLLVLTGFEKVNDWLRCVGVDVKMEVSSTLINTCNMQFNLCHTVSNKLHPSFPHSIHILKPTSPIFSNVTNIPTEGIQHPTSQKGSHSVTGEITNVNAIQNINPDQDSSGNPIPSVVFADSSGFYETISDSIASPICIPHNMEQSFDISRWLTNGEPFNILFLWCLQDSSEFCVDTFDTLAELARKILQANSSGKVNVWVVTQNAVHESSNIHGGTTWGLMRTIGQELNDACNARFHIVDIGAREDMRTLINLMSNNFYENECMIRNNELFVSRLVPVSPAVKDACCNDKIIYCKPATEDSVAFRLQPARNAQLSSMAFHTYDLPEVPPKDQITVQVHYMALNFRDLMVALDRLPPQSFEKSHLGKNLGIECSGIVTAVAPNVDWIAPGDKVMCTTGGCIANIIHVDHRKCFKIPENISMCQASSLLSVYLTAYYALIHMARLTRGMSCLVHSGMGGVGQATIHLAKYFGFDVYATAGTDEKRAKLLEMGCKGAYDSHSFQWAADLLRDTNGRGVDAVLNSLHGAHIELGLEVLAYKGWFCEIGKRDIYANSKIGMYALRKNITLTAVDTDSLSETHPYLARELCTLLVDLIAGGKLAPIAIEEYPVSDYLAAFRQMQQAKHAGKIVLSFRSTTPVPVVDHRPLFSPSGTYLVTGGLGGVGLRLLQYLYSNGVRNFLLTDSDVSRSRSVEFVKQITRMGSDVQMVIETADVSKYGDVEKVVAGCSSKLPPLKGVLHLAGVADGRFILAQNKSLYQKVLGAKAQGALNLHKATQQHCPQLAHFIMFSSIASALGSSGQANYAAANAFLDSLARYRRSSGLCATSYNMGGILDVGMASKNIHTRRALRIKGMNLVTCESALAALDYQLRNNIPEMIYANLNLDLTISDTWGYCTVGLLSKNSMSEAIVMSHNGVLNMICKQVQKLTGASEVPPTQPLSSFGVDSMMSTELSIWLKDKFNIQVSALRMMSAETCETITQKVLSYHSNKSVSSSSSTPSAALLSPSREGNVLLGIETDFLESKKISTQFPPAFSTTSEGFSVTIHDDVKAISVASGINNLDQTQKESAPILSNSVADTIAKDSREQVFQDIEDICNSFAKYMKVLEPASEAREFQNIFLTGATGFVGRVFLAYVLKNRPDIKVTCIVRAENRTVAMERVRDALEKARYWRDSYANNIIAIPGDLSQERLGQSEEGFDELCRTQHAVFHFAANISLIESYSLIRNDNTLVMEYILRLCSTFTKKPLHHMSTLNIFPEYNAGFPPAWSNKVLMEDDQPDFERFVSPKELGYPWSKWACEQVALRCCKLANIPVVIYRIPFLSSSTSDTGFMSDISMLVSIAALQEGIMPALSFPINYTALDTICEVVFNLALKTERKHNIYHVVSKEAHHWTTLWRWMNEVGFEVKYIEDEQLFLDTGTKPGSPLKRILPMLELMRAHWYYSKRPVDDPVIKNGLPISTVNTEEDFKKIKWPRAELCYVSAFVWMLRQGDKWEYPLPEMRLQLEGIMQHVQSFTGLTSMGPNSFYEPLARLIEALNAEANLSNTGRVVVRQDIWRRLLNRQHLFKAIQASPEILQTKIVRPIFLLGPPGGGGPYLHRALAEDPRFRAPYFFEMHCPVQSVNEIEESSENLAKVETSPDFSYAPDARLRKAYAEWQSRKAHAEAIGLQMEEVQSPGSDYAILQHDIQCLSWAIPCNIPSFRSWMLSKADMSGTYAFHKIFLQFLQHQGRNYLSPSGCEEYSWILDLPMHMMFLDHIFKTYPDAIIIQGHRPPVESISSWCSTVEKMRRVYSDEVDMKEIGQSQLKAMQEMLESIQTFRESHPELSERFIDLHYHDVVYNPVRALDKLYQKLIPNHNSREMKKYMRSHPALVAKLQTWQSTLEKDAKVPLNLEEFGLTKDLVEESCANYIRL